MMKNQILILLIILMSGIVSFGQAPIKKAQYFYERFNYTKTIDILAKENNKDTESVRMLANSYMKTGNYEESEKYFEQLFGMNDKTIEDIRGYMKILLINRKYTEALKLADILKEQNPYDISANLFLADTSYYQKLDNKHAANISILSFNSSESDFAPVIWQNNNKLIFTSSRYTNEQKISLSPDYNLPLYNLFSINFKDDKNPELLNLKSNYNKGAATFGNNGKLLIYSTNYKMPDIKGNYRLRLIQAVYKDEKWQNFKSLNINNKKYSVSQPYLTQDENTLYFVSDMPGGFGGMDIYKSEKQNNGIWSRPENLGSSINTEGDEAFPFLNEGFLFFASDGHPGLGGLDIFAAKITDNEVIYIENLGSPVNSNYDDFAIYLDSSGIAGFFTSNRPGGKGSDDIYSVKFESKYFDKSDIIEQRFVEDIPDSVNLDKNNLVITYTIQLGAFKRKIPVTHNFFRDFRGKVELKTGRDSLNHYIYGRYKNKTDAEQQLTVFHEQGFYDAFIRELVWYNEEKLYKSNIIE